ncbi:unnamed protein product [Effrenium voratum]|nr:unnamed protein product [Effrenium voratum]
MERQTFAEQLLLAPERCEAELARARQTYRPGLGSFQWEASLPVFDFSEELGAAFEAGGEQLRVLGEVRPCKDASLDAEFIVHLAFRGSVNQENLATNLQAQLVPLSLGACEGMVHRGFQDAYLALRPRLLERLRCVGRSALVRATGHSLGGALAMLACYDLATSRGLRCECVTWGAPRVGDAACGALLQQLRLARFVNRFDVVPRLPASQEDEADQGYLQQQLSSLLGVHQQRLGASGYVHPCPALELDASAAAAVLHWANAGRSVLQSLAKIRATNSHVDRASVAAGEVLKNADALFPHRMDAYERNLRLRLRGPSALLRVVKEPA